MKITQIRWGTLSVPLTILLCYSLVFSGCAAKNSGQQEYASSVKRVIDGDTIVLWNRERVRYIGIDTPELHHPKKPIEYLAKEAKEFNEKLVGGKKVNLKFDVEKRDKYGRLLAYVYLEDGTFVNADILKEGYAQLLTIPPNVKHVELFIRSQREARENNRGLWSK